MESSESCVDGQDLWDTMRSQLVWHPLKYFRSIEKSCLANEELSLLYAAFRSELESFVGNHAGALKFFDTRENSYSESRELPFPVISVSATRYIAKKAKNHRIVITNERHHASSDRLLPLSLLKPLYDQGYRYLAVEGYAHWDSINERGYPILAAGHYSNDVVYAQLLRSAIEVGFKVVGYEREASQIAPSDPQNPVNRQHEREMLQAQNIVARIFENDPNAKVLIHCGYGHNNERERDDWSSMAHILKNETGLDPLTVDQTLLSERSDRSEEHPIRQRAAELDLISNHPIVILDEANNLIRVSNNTDIQVLGLQTSYEYGRAVWLKMGGSRKMVSIETDECVDKSCIVEATSATESKKAAVYDRVEVSYKDRTVLYLPPGKPFNVHILDLDGGLLRSQLIHTGVP